MLCGIQTDFGKIITRNLPHWVALASILSLNDYPAMTPMYWGKPMQQCPQRRNWGRATKWLLRPLNRQAAMWQVFHKTMAHTWAVKTISTSLERPLQDQAHGRVMAIVLDNLSSRWKPACPWEAGNWSAMQDTRREVWCLWAIGIHQQGK